ncbi:MMPL family transporter [Sporolactobacillus shoreicorticis]|uniref:MMPL family transporter n=1 Tax=Sporolactobacillus shoreicorticis TaxID=1923877 RepID=A0ABW5RZN1_9BACL|nr:MMPL family transporter [Sporolactobacillus shoreicorticis]MCO7128151.1 MMPL family transporter [Sporolactobacillus shoreicorticis]
MRTIIKARWIILSIWLIATIVLVATQPDINAILRDKGQTALNSDSPSVRADAILDKMEKYKGTNDLIIFYDKNKISDAELDQIKNGVENLSADASKLNITEVVDPFSSPQAKKALISKDKTTIMVSFKLDKKSREIDDIGKDIDSRLSHVSVDHYLSGEDFINDDYLKTSQAGVEKSAALTIIFILVVLIVMFRSAIAPLVSLLAVMFSYLCSMGITAQLIDKTGFPVTNLTQMLLLLILFGIGTDYNILLFNRFNEELARGHSVDDSIIYTYKTAGKTIIYSMLTVFIAFLALIFAQSPIYKSGVVVVIGIVVLLLEFLTLTPFAMKLFGKKLFWPTRNVRAHKENRLWSGATSLSTKYPIISVIIVLLFIVPTIVLHQEKLNFDTIKELGNSHPSSKAMNIVADHFGKGNAMPTTVVLESKHRLDKNASLAAIDQLTNDLNKVKGVKQVASVTQPVGSEIPAFYIGDQTKSVTKGLSSTKKGVDQINDGLKTAQEKLGSADFSQISKMVNGTAKLQDGMTQLADGLKRIQSGLGGESSNSQNISDGIEQIQTNLTKMSDGIRLLSKHYDQMQSGYAKMGTSYQQTAQALLGVKDAIAQMQSVTAALGTSDVNVQQDANYIKLKSGLDQLSASLTQITPEGIKTLNTNYNTVTSGFVTANKNLDQMSNGLSQMAQGLEKMKTGLDSASSGIGTIVTNMDKVNQGMGQMKTGQQKLAEGLNGFNTFGEKLADVNKGLGKISNGLGQTNDFLSQLNSNKSFSIPNEALTDKQFQKSVDAFMSKDRTVTKMTVVLDDDPYSKPALSTIDRINATMSSGIKGTVLSDAKIGTSGPSATTNDMNNILTQDLNQLTIIVIVGVLFVLIIVMRAFWIPVFITTSLMGAYYAAMFMLNFIFIDLKGLDGISSFIPFFSFIIIVALGVDYSIFLLARFKEYPLMPAKEAIVEASKHIGSVIMSAAIILGGTFATLIPSGIELLVQWAVAVITGLVVLCFIMLPIFVPAMISLIDSPPKFNWWKGKKKHDD